MTFRTPAVLATTCAAMALGAALASPATAAPAPANAPVLIFSSNKPAAPIVPGRPVKTSGGTLQFRLPGGATVSLVGAADFTVTPGGALELRSGSATVVNDGTSPVQLSLPGGVTGNIGARGSASLSASAAGGSGSVLGGTLTLAGNGGQRQFSAGSFWSTSAGKIAQQGAGKPVPVSDSAKPAAAPAKAAAPTPAPTPAIRQASASQYLQAGFPAALAQQLAAAGANAEVIAAARRVQAFSANPVIAAFPRGDYNALAAYAAQAARLAGQPAFNGAQADIIAAYFQYLAAGRTGSTFLTAYGQILSSYLDLLRAGTLPSSFTGATQAQLTAWISYLGRTSGYGALTAGNQQLLGAYLDFLKGGGTADGFAPALASLTAQYLDFVRAGNDPASFTRLSQSVLLQYLAIVQSGGIKAQLSAQNQAFVDAYIASLKANGDGLAFLAQQSAALNAYLAYLQAGGLPSQYTALDQASLRAYLQALINAGLLNLKLGQNAAFYQAYYSYLAGGGAADSYAELPVNIWTSYAAALNAYYAYLAAGGVPTQYATLTQAQILAYLQTLVASGKFAALLGSTASFYNGYYSYLSGGGAPDSYASLPAAQPNPTPTPTPAPSTGNAVIASYQGGFSPGSSTQLYVAGPGANQGGWFRSGAPGVTSSGALAPSGTGTASAADVAGDSLGVIGRYTNGTFITTASPGSAGTSTYTIPANGGMAYAYMAPITGALPTDSSIINYDLYAATRPTYSDGHTAPGSFAANLSIKFSATPTYKMSGTVTMSDATYTFASPGASGGTYSSIQSVQKDFFVLWPKLSQTGPACTNANCILDFYGSFAGTTPQNRLGFAYYSFDGSNAPAITGAALFAAPGSYSSTSGGNTSGGGASGGGTTGGTTSTGVRFSGAGAMSISSLQLATLADTATQTTDVTATADGQLNAVRIGTVTLTRNSASNVDFGTAGGVISWTRWAGGSATYTKADNSTGSYFLAANGGYAHIWGTAASNLPTSGTATYSMVGATRPVERLAGTGGTAPGVLNSAAFAVAFATQKVGVEMSISMPNGGYLVSSTGGTANPQVAFDASGNFQGGLNSNGAQIGTFTGFLAGPAASHAGLSYLINGSVAGAVAFAKDAGSGGNTTTQTSGKIQTASTGGLSTQTTVGAGLSTFTILGRFSNSAGYVTTDASGLKVIGHSPTAEMSRGSALVVDAGNLGDSTLNWARWTDGTVSVVNPTSGQTTYNAITDGGYAHVWGTPATNLPTTGTVSYTLAGGTKPFLVSGGVTNGKVNSAALAVNFATKKVGFEASVLLGDPTYSLATSGGIAAPSVALDSTGAFSGQMQVNGTTNGGVSGFLAGPGGAYAGLVYQFSVGSSVAGGAITFSKAP